MVQLHRIVTDLQEITTVPRDNIGLNIGR